jgi:hypothetical protein
MRKREIEPASGAGLRWWELFIGVPTLICVMLLLVFHASVEMWHKIELIFYVPYMENGGIVHLPVGLIFMLCLVPACAMLLPVFVLAFVKEAFKFDFSRYQKIANRYFILFCYIGFAGLIVHIPLNLYLESRIEAKGYIRCDDLDHPGKWLRTKTYVLDPVRCVSEK